MRNLAFLLAFLCLKVGHSQNATFPKVIPPSPNAMAFQKYGDIPVSTHTGVPNISIPIHTATSGDIALPISLSYHASGIKVNEEASKVGLGWVLNAGGMISRSIVGTDDFGAGVAYPYHTNQVPELIQNISGNFGKDFNVQEGCTFTIFGNTYDYEEYDSEPDQYYYSLPNGKSGKFILKRNKEVILAKDELIDIQVLDNNANQWRIRTPDGFTYEFNTSESYYGNELINEFGYHKTAWYLTRIISNTGKTMTIKYTSSNNYVKTLGAISESRPDFVLGRDASGKLITNCQTSPYSLTPAPGRDYVNVQIDSILFKEGAIKFTYSNRLDVLNDQKLDNIEIFVKKSIGPITYERVKKLDLIYDYFVGSADRDIVLASIDLESKRLKLKRVVEKSGTNQTGYDYRFDYSNEFADAYTAPAKTSFARDHWGYYNGAQSNTSLIPVFSAVNSTDIARFYIGVMGDQRDPRPAYMNIFSLKRIWYPTGGYSEFELECHDFDVADSFTRDFSYFNYNPDADSKSIPFVYNGSTYGTNPATFELAQQAGKVIDLTKAYQDTYGNSVSIKMNAFFRFNTNQTSCALGGQNVTFELVSESGATYSSANIFALLNAPSPPSASCAGVPGNYHGISYNNDYNLPRGRYYWRLTIPSGFNLFADVGVSFTYFQQKEGIDFGGGLRIKRVLDYESPTANPQITRYDYHYWADKNGDSQVEECSYGRRMTNPNYSYFEKSRSQECVTINLITVCTEITCEALKRSSESTIPLANGGSAVSYDQVTVFYGENGENGKSIFRYHNLPDLLLNYTADTYVGTWIVNVPRRPPGQSTIAHELNGMLKNQYDFKWVGPSQFDTVRTVTNTYLNSHSQLSSMVWAVEKREINSSLPDNCTKYENYLYPSLQRTWVNLVSTIEKTFDQLDASKTTTRVTNNYYQNFNHFQLTRTEQQWDGRLVVTKLKYPLDYLEVECSPPVLSMRNLQTMYSPVIQKRTEEIVNGTSNVIAQDITRFEFVNGSMILPRSQASYLLPKPEPVANVADYIPASNYDTTKYRTHYLASYNGTGDIIMLKKPNDAPLSYIWGYQGTLPIAEVKNATPTQIHYTSFENFGEGNSAHNDAKTGTRSKTNGYSAALFGLTPGTYQLSWWSKSGTWSFQSQDVIVAGSTYTINLAGQVDEVRFHPKNAQMSTYVHAPLVGIRQVIDPGNTVTNYEYDSFNRLRLVKDESGNIVKQNSYNYKIK